MRLKYQEDINWHDLAKIETPFFASATVRRELNRPLSTLTGGFGSEKNPLDQIRRRGGRDFDHDKQRKFYRDIEDAKILLVHDFELSEHHQAFKFVKDDTHPDKGKWAINDHALSHVQNQLEGILRRVKKPKQPGSIKTSTTATSEYGYIPSSQGTSVAESTVTEAAKIIGKFLYQVGSKTVILSTLTPGTAGGSTTYDIPNEPDLRIYESPTTPPQYQRRVDGEWQATGIRAKEVIADGRVQGYEALSSEDMESLKSTGGIPIAPQVKPTIEGSPPDSPPDSSKLEFPDNQGQLDNSSSSFPVQDLGSLASPGYGDTDARDVVGSPVMYNKGDPTKIPKLEIHRGFTADGDDAVVAYDPNNPKTRVRFELLGDTVDITDINSKHIGGGQGSNLLVKSVKQANIPITEAKQFEFSGIINKDTIKAFENGIPASQSRLGKTGVWAAEELNIPLKDVRYETYKHDSKLKVVFEVDK